MQFTESEFYKIIDALEAHSRTSIVVPSESMISQILGANPMSFLDKIMGKGTADTRRINQLKFEVDTRNLTIKLLENKGEFVGKIEPSSDEPKRD